MRKIDRLNQLESVAVLKTQKFINFLHDIKFYILELRFHVFFWLKQTVSRVCYVMLAPIWPWVRIGQEKGAVHYYNSVHHQHPAAAWVSWRINQKLVIIYACSNPLLNCFNNTRFYLV